jgi:hypothetical protein
MYALNIYLWAFLYFRHLCDTHSIIIFLNEGKSFALYIN